MERTPQGVRSFFQLSFIRSENAGALFRLHREDLDIALTGIDREQKLSVFQQNLVYEETDCEDFGFPCIDGKVVIIVNAVHKKILPGKAAREAPASAPRGVFCLSPL